MKIRMFNPKTAETMTIPCEGSSDLITWTVRMGTYGIRCELIREEFEHPEPKREPSPPGFYGRQEGQRQERDIRAAFEPVRPSPAAERLTEAIYQASLLELHHRREVLALERALDADLYTQVRRVR